MTTRDEARERLARTASPVVLGALAAAKTLDMWAFEMARSAAAMRPLDRTVAEGNDRIARDLRSSADHIDRLAALLSPEEGGGSDQPRPSVSEDQGASGTNPKTPDKGGE